MKKTYFLLWLWLAWSRVLCQQHDLTLIYQITGKEAEKICRESDFLPDSTQFHTYIDSFHTPQYTRPLAPGHYLFVSAEWEQLVCEYRDLTTLSVRVLPDRRDLVIQALDSAGAVIDDAEIYLNRRRIPFDSETSVYRLRKQKRGGFLQVSARGETTFFSLEKEDVYPYRRRFRYTRTGRILTTPYRWGRGVYHYLRRGLGYGDWHINAERLLPQAWVYPGPAFKGYIAFSQPKYRPGDTLRVKAFLTRPTGRPWTGEAALRIYSISPFRGGSKVLDTLLSPNHPGNFTFETVLADSLTIDQRYNVQLSRPRKWRRDGLDHSFYLEDYQLDEVVYSFKAEKETFYRSDEITFIAEAKDQNERPVSGVELKLFATRGAVERFWTDEARIPDTLWRHTQMLEARGLAKITLPDSLLPPASLAIDVSATFVNAKGEIQDRSARFDYRRDTAYLSAWEEDGFVHARFYQNGQETPLSVHLDEDNWGQRIFRERKVDLPFRERIDPNLESYLFYRDSMEAELNISVEDAGLQAQGLHTGDSIVVWVSNPKQIPFTYRIGPRSRAVAAGRTESSFFRWTGGAAAGTPYHLEYQYIWGGQSREESLPIQFYENLLQIELDHPPKVTPGEEVGFKVTVKDAQGKPAAGVDLTAGAVNAQFGRGSAYSSPEIDYKRAKELRTHAYFDLGRPFYGSKIWKRALSPSWVAKLQLQDSLFYRLRYAGTGVYMEYNSLPQRDSVYRHLAQFAPYIVRRGKTQPVILIYCNRQLVYYYNVGDEPPYSFIGREGYNSLVVRTPDYEYIIDSVWLKNEHKLEIAIDEELFQTGSMAGKIRRKKMPDDLTAEERALLRRRFLLLHERHSDGPVFLWQDATSIHRIDGDQPQYPLLVGPFWNDQPLYFKIPLSWETTFDMESEFSYVLTENRQKLYHHPLFSGPGVTKLPRALLPKPVGETVYTPAVLEDPPATAAVFPRDLRVDLPDTGKKPAGRYQFDYVAPKDSAIVAMALIGPDSSQLLFPADRRDFYPLIPGRYQLILLTTNYYYFQHAFEVQANSLLYEYLGNVPWQHDHTCRIRALFYAKRSTDEPEKNGEKESTSFRYDYRHYIGPGYPIEGTVTDETGEPLIGATILIRGTTIATVSDLEGRYSLTIPYDIAQPEIEVFYTGYSSQMAALDRRARSVDVALEAGAMLQESIVTGYGIAGVRTNATASTEELSQALAGKVAGVVVTGENDFLRIRGLRSANTLYFVDGRPVAGIDHLRPEDIAQAYKVEEPKAKAAYGANDLQNVVVITTRNVSGLSFSSDQAPSGIRSLFRDQAFWRPILRTDRKGEAFFKAVFPDNLTSWDAFILGMDGKKRAGTSTVNIQSYKPVTGQLAVPRFLVTGDRTQIVGAAVNYTNDTLPVKTRFLLDDQVIFEKEQRLTGNLIDKMDIEADTDSLTLTYKLETAGYFDGERRSIPVLPKGLSTQKGQFWVLSRDTALIYEPDPQLGPVQLHVQEDILPLLLEDLRYLRSYPYGCNEQTASRLLALLLERDIRKEQGAPFPYERQISRMVERLEKSQNIDGSWGWWAGNGVNEWMSVYVLRALYRASVDGHSTDALEKGLRRLTNRLSQLQREDRLQALELLSETGQRLPEGALQFFDTLRLDLTEQLRLIRIRQQQAMPYTLDSLYQYEKQSLLGGRYWQSTENYRHGSVTTPTLLAYQILRKEGREDVLAGIRQYFLETRGRYTRYGWLNTFETAQILQTILPDISGPSSGATGQETTENLEVNGQKISNFPFRRQYALDQPVRISKSGNRPFFLTVHQEQFLPEPVANRDVFDIHSYWMQQDRKVQKLEAAIPAKLVIEVELKSAAQYVMLQIPIPGGCSYYAKPGAGWGGLESHREYFKDRTVIFCESLPAGLHRFEVELEPRFKGAYTINPVRAEQMYFPTFSGNNACEVMEVGQ